MHKNQKIAVIVPAYNEEKLILSTLKGIPGYVDRIFVINDASTDTTKDIVLKQAKADPRIKLIDHEANMGLGQSLIDGYLYSAKSDADISVVMAGDNQMDPHDLPGLLNAIIDDGNDYVKGNRLLHADINSMPGYRFFGNAILTILTKFATGYYSLMDPQCGYTAIKNSALKKIPIEKMTKGYGYNADILNMLNIQRFKVTDIEVRPVYGSEKTKIKLYKYIPTVSLLLISLFFRRLWKRYIVLDFHPLALFYLFSFSILSLIVIPFSVRLVYMFIMTREFPSTTMLILTFSTLMAFQSILFAIWMDMEYNRK